MTSMSEGRSVALLADCPPQPWRNGGGTTRELLAWPPARGAHEPWRLRVSVAEIAADGPFSSFPGVERWFAVLRGDGVRLALPSGDVTLTPDDAPLAFDGEAAPMCRLVAGPTRDLNVMARRGAGVATLRIAAPGSRLEGDVALRALYTDAAALLDVDGRIEALAPGTLWWSDVRDAAAWTLREGRRAFWLTLEDA